MRNEQVPHDRLESLRVRRHVIRVHRGDNHARRRFFRGVAAVAAHDADDGRPGGLRHLNGADQIWADVLLQIAAADRENEQAVLARDAAALEPFAEDRRPAFIVGAGGEFRDIVRRSIGLKAADFSEVIHRMASVRGTATHAEDEQPSPALADFRQLFDRLLDGFRVQAGDDFLRLFQILLCECHARIKHRRLPVEKCEDY